MPQETMNIQCMSIDAILEILMQLQETVDCDDRDPLDAAILIINELKEYAYDLESLRDMLYDYNSFAESYSEMHRKFEVADRPLRRNGKYYCPACKNTVLRHHTHCHWCGKKLNKS